MILIAVEPVNVHYISNKFRFTMLIELLVIQIGSFFNNNRFIYNFDRFVDNVERFVDDLIPLLFD